jgi:hypothetical protein
MSVLFMDSFDKYATDGTQADLLHFYATADVDVRCNTGGRNINELEIEGNGRLTSITFAPSSNVGVAGFAYKFDANHGSAFFHVNEAGVTEHLFLKLVPATGLVEVRRGPTSGGTVLGTSSTALLANTWYYIEFKWTIHNATGAFELRINTVVEASATNQDTQNAGSAAWSLVRFAGNPSLIDTHVDDFYLLDAADSGVVGAPNNDFLGDSIVEYLAPTGNGTSSELVGQDADSVDNYLNVDETPGPDGDTTYNETNVVSAQDSYALANLGALAGGGLKAIQAVAVVRKTSASARELRSVIRHSGVDYYGTPLALATAYGGLRQIEQGKNPGGGTTVWATADIDALEVGVDLST